MKQCRHIGQNQMKMNCNLKMAKVYLKNYGHTDNELDRLDEKELFELYKTQSSKRFFEFRTALEEEVSSISFPHTRVNIKNYQEIKEKIKKNDQDISKIYDIFDEYVYKYTYEDILEIFRSNLPDISSSKIEKMLKVKYREFQEIWLEKIKERLCDLPEEEKLTLISFYEKNTNNIEKLKYVYQNSAQSNYIKVIKNISKMKLEIIKNFIPSVMEENYKDFFKETPEKIKLINNIIELTPTYSKKFLLELDIEKLEFLENEIIEQNKKEIYDKQLFQEYVKSLEDAMNSPDDNVFEKVCLEAITKLDEAQLQSVVDHMCSKNSFFINKFNVIARSNQSKMKNKNTYLFKNTH